MSDLLSPSEIEARAKASGLTLAELCRKAGIAPSTFSRWKAGTTEPTLDVYRRLRDAASPDALAPAREEAPTVALPPNPDRIPAERAGLTPQQAEEAA